MARSQNHQRSGTAPNKPSAGAVSASPERFIDLCCFHRERTEEKSINKFKAGLVIFRLIGFRHQTLYVSCLNSTVLLKSFQVSVFYYFHTFFHFRKSVFDNCYSQVWEIAKLRGILGNGVLSQHRSLCLGLSVILHHAKEQTRLI